jgi:hypothetical protein
VDIPDEIKYKIAEKSQGCPREILVLLDQVIDLQEDQMLSVIGSTEEYEAEVRELCQAMLKNKPWRELSKILKAIKNKNVEGYRQAIMGYMRVVCLNDVGSKGDSAARAAFIYDCFKEPDYENGFNSLVFNTYNTTIS